MILLIFPHQLFENHPGLDLNPSTVVLIEDSLFFGDWHYPLRFHKQKLWLHRATMKRFEVMLQSNGYKTCYLDYDAKPKSLDRHLQELEQVTGESWQDVVVAEPNDFILRKRIEESCNRLEVKCRYVANPGFINQPQDNHAYREGKKRWFMADFYKFQRRRMDLLMDGNQPLAGKWSFDKDNRKKVPRKLLGAIPAQLKLERDEFDHEAVGYVQERFAGNPGSIDQLYFPSSHADALTWLRHFLQHRFEKFGDYEDAIVEGESWLWHSILTPSLNTGLLTPDQVIQETMAHAETNEVSLNSMEGFVRQIIGWREFIRATYDDHGTEMRTSNHWNLNRKIPETFYDGTTGIPPIDDTIHRILKTGYCHHIERLMVLGGFMFLCEFEPNEIYQWFMEMFVDSYDWVMVPNVYAMSQHADGGLITTKPYFSGSSYIRKMSHYKKESWCDIWDGLYWRWIWNHADELVKNPRWAMMCRMVQKMDPEKRDMHLLNGASFLATLDR